MFTMCCVTKAMLIYFINGMHHIKQLKAKKAFNLFKHTQSISHHITLLVINVLRGGHTDTHILAHKPKEVQETKHTSVCGPHTPDLKTKKPVKLLSDQRNPWGCISYVYLFPVIWLNVHCCTFRCIPGNFCTSMMYNNFPKIFDLFGTASWLLIYTV